MRINRYINKKFWNLERKYIRGYGYEYQLLKDFITEFLERLENFNFNKFDAFEAVLFLNKILQEHQYDAIRIQNINKNADEETYKNIIKEKYNEIEKDIIDDEKLW